MTRKHRDVRRRLEQFAANPTCDANSLSAVHDVAMADVARAEGCEPRDGQSPFAIQRGTKFEQALCANDALALRQALAGAGVVASSDVTVVDLRLRAAGGPMVDLDAASTAFAAHLADAVRSPRETLVLGAAVRIPARQPLAEGAFAIDVLALRPEPGALELRVGEIKSYPDRGGFTDPGELAQARAQAGLYVHVLRVALEALGLANRARVADDGFLVLSRPGRGNHPSVRAGEDLRFQARRAAVALDRLRALAERVALTDAPPERRLAVVQQAPTAYGEACVAFCPRAQRCREAALAAGDPAVLGRDVLTLLGPVRLPRALALLEGREAPANDVEADLLRRIAESGEPVVTKGKVVAS